MDKDFVKMDSNNCVCCKSYAASRLKQVYNWRELCLLLVYTIDIMYSWVILLLANKQEHNELKFNTLLLTRVEILFHIWMLVVLGDI